MNKYNKNLAKLNKEWQFFSIQIEEETENVNCICEHSNVVAKLRHLSRKFYIHNLDQLDSWVAKDTARQLKQVDLFSCSLKRLVKFWKNFPNFPSPRQLAFSKQIVSLAKKIIKLCPCPKCRPKKEEDEENN